MNRHIFLSSIIALSGGVALTSCSNDMDKLYTSGQEDVTLKGDKGDVILSADALDALVLTLYWNDNGSISTSDPGIKAPQNVAQNTIELSCAADFSIKHEVAVGAGVYEYQFICRDLNGILTKLGYEPGTPAPLYVRIKSSLANNLEPKYSETMQLSVSPYFIDTTIGFFLNASKEDTGRTLYSREDNHIYEGFIGAGAWENWWLKEGDGTIWGNDGESGTPFVISSKDTAWNFWYPGISGCYYTVVNTQTTEWTALLIESISVDGDIQGEMAYERKLNQWTLHVSGSGTKNITLSGSGKQYNAATGTDDAAAIATAVAFGGDASALSFSTSGAAQGISVAIDGECDLILDLNDPTAWTLSAGTAQAPAEGPAETIWVVGHNDGITGGWNFDSWLRLYNEDNANYGGVLDINSLWGYKLYKEQDNWDDCWGMVAGGTGYEGSLVADGGDNIAAPDPGLYVMDVSLSGLYYHLYPVNSVHYTGLNDDWSLSEMTATETPGVYTATVTKSAETPWGVKVLINESWDLFFGGGSGYLRLYQDGFDGDNDLGNGTYTLTVNLCEGTYSYSE